MKETYDHMIDILSELDKAKEKHPNFPKDIIHQVAIMVEESGEAMRAALQLVYEGGSKEELQLELKQTGAMCIRCLENI